MLSSVVFWFKTAAARAVNSANIECGLKKLLLSRRPSAFGLFTLWCCVTLKVHVSKQVFGHLDSFITGTLPLFYVIAVLLL